MDAQNKKTTELRHDKVWFAITSFALCILAIIPFGFLFLLQWLNANDYYLNPLLLSYGICPAGGIGLFAIFRTEINLIKKHYSNEPSSTRTLQSVYKTLTILGIISALVFMYLMVGYVVTTYMMN